MSSQGCTSAVESGAGRAVPLKKYTVDLDQPPEKRWLPILQEYNSSLPLIINYFNNEVYGVFHLCIIIMEAVLTMLRPSHTERFT